MFKLFGKILILIMVFVAGYLVGAKKLGRLEKDLSTIRVLEPVRNQISEKKAELDKKLANVRLRLRLADVKERLGDARVQVMDKNYGTAEKEILDAKKTLDSLLGDANDDLRKELTPITVGLDEVKTGIDKMDPKVKAKLETLRSQLSEIQKKITE